MKNSLKGALLSGLVFPGLGQLVLKHYRSGVSLMLLVMGGLFVIVRISVQQAYAILDKIEADGGTPDMEAISRAVAQSATPSDSLIINLVTLLMILCWLFGIVHAYRIGKRMDLDAQDKER
jgi:TM2 domain-containing membrane protein YozV